MSYDLILKFFEYLNIFDIIYILTNLNILDIFDIINIISTIILTLTAIFSCYYATKQINLSNKQSLFDRRLKNYSIINELLLLYNNDFIRNIKDRGTIEDFSLYFIYLTNSGYWYSMSKVINNFCDLDKKIEYLLKIEQFKNMILETEVLWQSKDINTLLKFLNCYLSVLEGIYSIEYYKFILNSDSNLTPIAKEKRILNYINDSDIYKKFKSLDSSYNDVMSKKLLIDMKKELVLK